MIPVKVCRLPPRQELNGTFAAYNTVNASMHIPIVVRRVRRMPPPRTEPRRATMPKMKGMWRLENLSSKTRL